MIDALRGSGQDDFANMVAAGERERRQRRRLRAQPRVIIAAVLVIYVASAFLSWIEGYVINVIMVRTMWRLREEVEAKLNRLPWRTSTRSSAVS